MNRKKEYIVGLVVVCIFPLLIAVGTSADILNWATNDNDWIEFWGGYIGSVLGGVITLFVMFKSLADSKKTLQETLSNERYIQERNEVSMFSNLLIEKCAKFSIEVEEMIYKGHHCVVEQKETRKVDIERINECLKTIRIVRSILIQISMHMEVVGSRNAYCTNTRKKLYETVEELIELVKQYNHEFLGKRVDPDIEKKILELSNDLLAQAQDYLKEI